MGKRGRPPYPDVLTPREWEVHALLRDGLSNEEIAERLGISLAGAKYHVSEILSKLGVSSREEAAAIEPERRRWGLAALAPAGLLGKKASFAVAGLAAIAVAAGIGVLLWGLLRTEGGEKDATVEAAGIANVVQAIESGDRETLLQLIEFKIYECTTRSMSSPSNPPLCPDGLPEGSPLELFPYGTCEFAPVSREGIDYVIDRLVGRAVHGVYDARDDPSQQSQTAVLYRDDGTYLDVGSIGINSGRIVSFADDCGPATPEEWAASLDLGERIDLD